MCLYRSMRCMEIARIRYLCDSLSFFFFSSRRRHTRFDCDWSSDVCSSDLKPQPVETRATWIDGTRMKTAVYDRATLGHGHVIKGPAIIGEYSSTTLVPRDFECRLDTYLNLVLSARNVTLKSQRLRR